MKAAWIRNFWIKAVAFLLAAALVPVILTYVVGLVYSYGGMGRDFYTSNLCLNAVGKKTWEICDDYIAMEGGDYELDKIYPKGNSYSNLRFRVTDEQDKVEFNNASDDDIFCYSTVYGDKTFDVYLVKGLPAQDDIYWAKVFYDKAENWGQNALEMLILFGAMELFLLIFLLAAFMAFPLYYTVIQSLKPIEEIFRFPPTLYVSRPVMDNYGEMFRILANMWVPLSRYLFNTLFIAVLGTGLHVLVAGMAAYPLAKHNFPGRNLIFGVIMLGLLFVNQVTFVPSFVIIAKLDILNTYLAYLLPTIGVSLGLFLMRQFISQLPDSMLEAAKIDGANEHRVFFSIVFPSIKPAVITVIIFQFINLWNGLPSDVVYNEEFKSLTQAMSQITAANAYARYGPSMAASVIMMIPPIVIFVSLQSKVIETMTSAGIKG